MATRHIIVIGASAGGIEALRALVSGLPSDFQTPIGIVMHTAPQAPGVLSDILSRVGPLRGTGLRPSYNRCPAHRQPRPWHGGA